MSELPHLWQSRHQEALGIHVGLIAADVQAHEALVLQEALREHAAMRGGEVTTAEIQVPHTGRIALKQHPVAPIIALKQHLVAPIIHLKQHLGAPNTCHLKETYERWTSAGLNFQTAQQQRVQQI